MKAELTQAPNGWTVTPPEGPAVLVFVPAGETSAQAAIAAWTQAQAPRVPDPAERALQIKAECRRRIYAVANETAQMNLAGAAVSGMLTPAQMEVYAEGVAWVMAMRAHCAALIADPGLAPAWPEPSDAVRTLAAAY